jgi:hypothetical protein
MSIRKKAEATMGFSGKVATFLCLSVLALSDPARPFQEESFSIPENLVVDLRVFEARSINPNYDRLDSLSFFIDTDGRQVTANQWLATLAGKIPGSFLAAIAFKTVRVRGTVARFEWFHRSRGFHVDIDLSSYHPSGRFEAQCHATWKRRGETLRQFVKPITLKVGQTSAWSAEELEVDLRDYLSNFRGYRDGGHRGLLFEKLQSRSIHLILVATPRLLADDETAELSPEKLQKPADRPMPEFDNPLGIPLFGSVVVGFEIGPSGTPLYPQIVWSTVPEANPRVLNEVILWRFPPPKGATPGRRWGVVALEVDVP